MAIVKSNPDRGTLMPLLLAVSLSIAGFFSWIMLVNSLRIPFYMYYERTIFLIYVDRFIDPIIWILFCEIALILYAVTNRSRSSMFLASILSLVCGIAIGTLTLLGAVAQGLLTAGPLLTMVGCALAGFVAARSVSSPGRRNFAIVSLFVVCLLVLPAELGSLVYYVLSAFQPGITVGKSWELLETQLWYTAFPLIPFLYVTFVFSWIWVPLVLRIFPTLKPAVHADKGNSNVGSKNDRTWLWLTASCILISVFLGWYPYFHDASYPLVGTDIYWQYATPARSALSYGTLGEWAAAIGGRQPLVVLGVVLASDLIGSGPEFLLRYVYVFLILAFSGSIFLTVKLAFGSSTFASLSALAASVSSSTTVGISTGIIGNWLALIVWTVALTPLVVENCHGHRLQVMLGIWLGCGSLLVLFVHPWSWIVFIAVLAAYSALIVVSRSKLNLHDLIIPVPVIMINAIAVGISLFYLPNLRDWGLANALSLIESSIRSSYLGLGSWGILIYFSQTWSTFLHPLFLSLSVLGAFALIRHSRRIGLVVFAWIVAACATTVVAAPMSYNPLIPSLSQIQLFRAMFLTPFQIPLATGIYSLGKSLNNKLGRSYLTMCIVTIFLSILFLAILNGSLRALFPLLTDPHNYQGAS